MGRIAGLIAVGTFAIMGADDIAAWRDASTDIAGPTSIQQVADSAYFDWELNGGDWKDALRDAGDSLRSGHIEVDGVTLRWQQAEICWEAKLTTPETPIEPERC